MKIRYLARKVLAVAALLTILVASIPALAETFSASDSPACCNTIYCPVHHRQVRGVQKDKSDCDAHGKPTGSACSIRACDATPTRAVGNAPFTLSAPYVVLYEVTAQAAPLSRHSFAPFVLSRPSTPPPRTLPS